jgi:predicted phosphoadenosine phosphosulfate sulfurtransferase
MRAKPPAKLYNKDKSVLDAAYERIKLVFDRYTDEKIFVNFSGGKDSTCVLFLCFKYAEKHNRKFNIIFIDQEIENITTIHYIESIREKYKEQYLKFYWVCPRMWRKVTFLDDKVIEVWANDESKNVRPLPADCFHHDMTMKMPKKSSLIRKISASFYAEQKLNGCAFLLGLRAQESLRRYVAVTSRDGISGIPWSSKGTGSRNFNFYPIYDWYDKDDWKFIADNNIPYNPIYDMYYQKNMPVQEMRTASILNVNALKKIELIKEVDIAYYDMIIRKIADIAIMEDKEIRVQKIAKAKAIKKRGASKDHNMKHFNRLKEELKANEL